MAKRKYKSKLAKIAESNEVNIFEPTLEDCVKWFRVLNREMFSNGLPDINEFDIGWRRKSYAYYTAWDDDKDPTYRYTKISMNKKYKSKKFFVECLAHEMVHHYQFIYDEPVNHGPSFQNWNAVFKKKGLKI